MTTEKVPATSNNPLEQFVLLAKSAKGAAAVELIKQVLEAPGVHVFGELLDMPNIIELEPGPHANYYQLLRLFAYGTYRQYLENKAQLLDLSPMQKKKLQHLTIVTLATKTKCIPYSVLLQELDIKNVRDLEDLIIEAIYADIIHGKLDQKNSQLEVDYAIGRDIQPGDLGSIVNTLQEWCDSCEAVLSQIRDQGIEQAGQIRDQGIEQAGQIRDQGIEQAGQIRDQGIEQAGQIRDQGIEQAGQIRDQDIEQAGQLRNQGIEQAGQLRDQDIEQTGQLQDQHTQQINLDEGIEQVGQLRDQDLQQISQIQH